MSTHAFSDLDMSTLLVKGREHYFADGLEFTSKPKRRGRKLLAPFAAALRWIASVQRRAAVVRELSLLSDRELADIGLNRNDLQKVFDAPAKQSNESFGRGFNL